MTKAKRHVIGDIHYGDGNGPSWLVCDTDGARLDAPTPDALAVLWQGHGGKAKRADSDIDRQTATPKVYTAPRCRFDGCPKGQSHRAAAKGYCHEHGWVAAGIPAPRRGPVPMAARA